MKKVLSFLGREKKNIVIAMVAVVIETSFELVIPFIMSYLIDNGVKAYLDAKAAADQAAMDTAYRTIFISAGMIAICALMSLINGWFYSHFSAKASARYGYLLRQAQFDAIQNYSFTALDSFEPSSLVTRVVNDSMTLQNTLSSGIRPFTRAPIMLILGIVFSFLSSWQLALVFVVLTPILALFIFFVLRYVAPKYVVLQEKLDRLNDKVQENLLAIRAIKSFVRKPYECKQFNEANSAYRDTVKSTFRIANLNLPFFQLIMYVGTILFLLLGGRLILAGTITEGNLTAVLSYVMQTFNSLMMISAVFISIAKALASIYRVNEVLSVVPDIRSGSLPAVEKGDIEFKDVSFRYAQGTGEDVLQHISFKLESGKTLGILGATGSAKSTLVSLIPRLYDVTKGAVLIDGKNVKEYDLKGLRSSIAMVLQKAVLFEGTVLENLEWGKENPTEAELNEALRISCTDEFVSRLPEGIYTQVGEGGNGVSGGQKQRISLARAILKHPKVLILDDATSAVDTATEKNIRNGLSELKDMTKIIISQRVLSVLEADEVMILEGGKINEINTPAELLEHNPIFQDLYNRQLGGISHE